MALKLEELFHKKAKENNTTCSFDRLGEITKTPCQNSDNPVSINRPVSDVPETVDYEEDTLTYQPKNISGRSEKALEIIDDFKKPAPKISPVYPRKIPEDPPGINC